MSKELLIETRHFVPKPVKLIEGMNKSGNIFVEGVLATVEVKNGNGRYYKKELWDNQSNTIQVQKQQDVVSEKETTILV
jgi:hypothetical protein